MGPTGDAQSLRKAIPLARPSIRGVAVRAA